jgi:hypothetical protein
MEPEAPRRPFGVHRDGAVRCAGLDKIVFVQGAIVAQDPKGDPGVGIAAGPVDGEGLFSRENLPRQWCRNLNPGPDLYAGLK